METSWHSEWIKRVIATVDVYLHHLPLRLWIFPKNAENIGFLINIAP